MKILYFTMSMLFALASAAFSETLDELFQIALSNDSAVRKLELELQRLTFLLEQGEIGDSLDISVATDETGLVMSYDLDDSDSLSVSADPVVTVTLPDPPGTVIEASATLSLTPFDLNKPVIGVKQSLNTLNPNNIDRRIEELTNRASLTQLRNDLDNAVRASKIALLNEAKAILSFQRQIGEADRAVRKQQAVIEEEETLGSVSTGSAHFLELTNTLRQAERHRDRVERDYVRYVDRFTEKTGVSPDMFPSELPMVEIVAPVSYGAENDISLFVKEIEREKAALAVAKAGETSLSAGASYDIDETKLSASLSAGFPALSLTGGASYDLDDRKISASLGFGWSRNGKRLAELDRMTAESKLVTSEIDLELAHRNASHELEDLISEIQDFEESEIAYRESRAYTELYLAETRALFESGIADADTLDDAEWDMRVSEYDSINLAINRIILAYSIEGLTAEIIE